MSESERIWILSPGDREAMMRRAIEHIARAEIMLERLRHADAATESARQALDLGVGAMRTAAELEAAAAQLRALERLEDAAYRQLILDEADRRRQ